MAETDTSRCFSLAQDGTELQKAKLNNTVVIRLDWLVDTAGSVDGKAGSATSEPKQIALINVRPTKAK